jgi:hypothetical protein
MFAVANAIAMVVLRIFFEHRLVSSHLHPRRQCRRHGGLFPMPELLPEIFSHSRLIIKKRIGKFCINIFKKYELFSFLLGILNKTVVKIFFVKMSSAVQCIDISVDITGPSSQ